MAQIGVTNIWVLSVSTSDNDLRAIPKATFLERDRDKIKPIIYDMLDGFGYKPSCDIDRWSDDIVNALINYGEYENLEAELLLYLDNTELI